ncbi:hypothetical protein A33Q_3391 [Indibacter alkaliphilus LW1]|uniref:Uncharacterized protein n=1 Tax=Indibacter alkaliphilus (strain CCUG 57479 / KCTC 22604 / LW1) TaxID=1189612 RepID=S2DSZ6_INDAL|nr:hypothetical protein A33Q_3391 [Indibacter alkaliphilus LW1]
MNEIKNFRSTASQGFGQVGLFPSPVSSVSGSKGIFSARPGTPKASQR